MDAHHPVDEELLLYSAQKILLLNAASIIRYGNLWNPKRRSIELDELRGYLETFKRTSVNPYTLQPVPKPEILLNQPLHCMPSDSWRTILEEALFSQDPDVVRIVLEVGVDPNHIDLMAHTPLDYAIFYNMTRVKPYYITSEMITEKRNIVELLNDFGSTKLMRPCSMDLREIKHREKYEKIIIDMQKYAPGGPGFQKAHPVRIPTISSTYNIEKI